MSTEVISFNDKGGMTAMHSDNGVINKQGRMQVERATEILHDAQTGKWYIDPREPSKRGTGDMRSPDIPQPLKGFAGYEAARALEVCWVKSCHLEGVDFRTDTEIAEVIRYSFDTIVARKSAADEIVILPYVMVSKNRILLCELLAEIANKVMKISG